MPLLSGFQSSGSAVRPRPGTPAAERDPNRRMIRLETGVKKSAFSDRSSLETGDLPVAGRDLFQFGRCDEVLDAIVRPLDTGRRNVEHALGTRHAIDKNDIRGDEAADRFI